LKRCKIILDQCGYNAPEIIVDKSYLLKADINKR
jgi:hypothetical protein